MIDFKKLLEAIESSGVQKCLDLGFDEGFCINLTKWYAAFIALLSKLQDKAYEEAAKRLKKEEQVSSLLDDYFNRWTFTLDNGETVTVPYFMKTKDRINKRKKLPEVDNILHMAKIISQKWAADFKKSEFDCQSYNIGDDINLGKGSP